MLIALLQTLAAQTSPSLSVGDGFALAGLTALVTFAATFGLLRGQVSDLRERVKTLETSTSTTATTMATLTEQLRGMEKRVIDSLEGLRRELHASGALPAPRREP